MVSLPTTQDRKPAVVEHLTFGTFAFTCASVDPTPMPAAVRKVVERIGENCEPALATVLWALDDRDAAFAAFTEAARAHPLQVAVRIGYDEGFAHRVFGATDLTLVPSRYEPCGLTQLYGLRYGTRAALINVAGAQAGLAIVIGIVAVGLTSLMATMGYWFDWVRFAGAANHSDSGTILGFSGSSK